MTYAFFKGAFVPLSEAKISVMTHALHYGTVIFEGIRGNWNPDDEKIYIFRLQEHYQRFLEGCRILRINLPYSLEDLCRITTELVERSGYRQDIYIRPLAFKSAERIAVLKLFELEDDFTLFTIPFGQYLNLDAAIRCCTSSWRRIDDLMIPPRVKIGGHYVNSILAKTEAALRGFDEAILLNQDGHVSEGSGENVFLVRNGKLITPSVTDNILPGITRDTVLQLARDELGLETEERPVDRSELYSADECFLTGTAAHITPVGEVDGYPLGNGQVGPVTKRMQSLYFEVIRGRHPRYRRWCTPVSPRLVKV